MTPMPIDDAESVAGESYSKSHRLLIALIVFVAIVALVGPKCFEMGVHGRLVQQSNGLLTSREVHTMHDLARARLLATFPDFGLATVELEPFPQGQTVEFTFQKIQSPIFPRSRVTPAYTVCFHKTNQSWRVVSEWTTGGWR